MPKAKAPPLICGTPRGFPMQPPPPRVDDEDEETDDTVRSRSRSPTSELPVVPSMPDWSREKKKEDTAGSIDVTSTHEMEDTQAQRAHANILSEPNRAKDEVEDPNVPKLDMKSTDSRFRRYYADS